MEGGGRKGGGRKGGGKREEDERRVGRMKKQKSMKAKLRGDRKRKNSNG